MAYFQINGYDFSSYVNKLKIGYEHIYKAQTNANGNTLVKYINTKRIIEVGIIPLNEDAMSQLQSFLNTFKVDISYLDAETGELKDIACIIPHNSVEYYTVYAGNTKFKAFSLEFKEL